MRYPLSATELIDRVLDVGSFRLLGHTADAGRDLPEYAAELDATSERTRLDKPVITGEGLMRGRRMAVVACEFGFLAGSIGSRQPSVSSSRWSGRRRRECPCSPRRCPAETRMQQGTIAFVQTVKISSVIATPKVAGLPCLVYLRHPTIGGVMASWGSLGHVTVTEPDALVGFLGPRDRMQCQVPRPSGLQRRGHCSIGCECGGVAAPLACGCSFAHPVV